MINLFLVLMNWIKLLLILMV